MKPQLKPAVMAAITRQQSLLYLTLILGHEIFAWEGLHVRDVVDHEAMSEMSGMPAFICGGVYWEGEAVPVVDLEARLTRRTTPVTRYTRIVILEMMQGRTRQLLGVVMNPLSRAHEGLRSAADIRRTLGTVMDAEGADDAPLPVRFAAPPRRQRGAVQGCSAE
ncbi:MAG TPA: chemotaxis protein CheW [Rhodocyclaceae bacterium]